MYTNNSCSTSPHSQVSAAASSSPPAAAPAPEPVGAVAPDGAEEAARCLRKSPERTMNSYFYGEYLGNTWRIYD